MLLDVEIKEQLVSYLSLLEGDITLIASLGKNRASEEMRGFLQEIEVLSDRVNIVYDALERTPSFGVSKSGELPRVFFAGIPLGHEFNSFVLALLQVSGRKPKIDDALIGRIKALKGPLRFETYISLSCHNCPDVVQALNIMSALNPEVSHVMIDGGTFQEEVTQKDIMGVPAVYLGGDFFEGGRMALEDILEKLGSKEDVSGLLDLAPFDVLVIGGGPAGASAAVYAARKGIRTGVIADRFGGQVLDTVGVENWIGTPYTEGAKIAQQLLQHVQEYPIELIQKQRVATIHPKDASGYLEVVLESGVSLKSKTVIVATGARWRNVNAPGEQEFKNKGVAYCPHCDGPLYKGKRVAVIGGGNSGVEAALDLAGIVSHVTVLEFMESLKADQVLQERLRALPNATIITNAQTEAITGQEKVDGIIYKDRGTGESHNLALEGVFVQIGLLPNTEWLKPILTLNALGEIPVDSKGATSIPGLFAAGDCTDAAFKQIVIAIGSGATAALGAFDYLVRHG